MKSVNVVLGIIGITSLAVLGNQYWIHRRLNLIETYLIEVYNVMDTYVQEEVDEKFLDIIERFDEE